MHSGIFNFCPFSPKFLIFGKVASDIGTFSRQLLLWCVLVQPWVLNGYATCGGKQQFDLKVNCEDFTCYTVNTVYSVKQNLKNIWKQIFSKKKKGYDNCFERHNLVSCAALLQENCPACSQLPQNIEISPSAKLQEILDYLTNNASL